MTGTTPGLQYNHPKTLPSFTDIPKFPERKCSVTTSTSVLVLRLNIPRVNLLQRISIATASELPLARGLTGPCSKLQLIADFTDPYIFMYLTPIWIYLSTNQHLLVVL